jgi:hypothetical protein
METEVTDTKGIKNAVLSSITHNAVLVFMVICLLENSSGYVADISALSPLRCFTVQGSMNLTTYPAAVVSPVLKYQLLELLTGTTEIISRKISPLVLSHTLSQRILIRGPAHIILL